ncbi:E3 ubiquitin-protein ligase rififylin isoform X2 [Corythoichthys intestinalis]|nr:E3 ubiquitin-protein ligase rififylin isoform X2 [Corythoichthys intestinalis]XP_057695974.1 E3 ubiquitin-protein ligase rififylin isoform X2 [Corythoichthys intestinalis]XP_057695975.1 E3 ubiquitin-protein ligase rififylin isoform X2 [Corythoichthys intestinalis]XP_061811909.1 E3 ubiquitin-protein ligase rififylin-like [Nerophis lumbriciformis]
MWGSCCHWCLEPSDEQAGGAEPQPRSYTNSAFAGRQSPPPEQPIACKACGRCLDAPVAEHVCADCKEKYCNVCSARSEPRPRLCHTCRRFHGNLLQRAELMKLKVKELRDYLHLHHVATHLCREKEELVELVMSRQASPSESPAGPPETEPDPPTPYLGTSVVELPDWTPVTETPESPPADVSEHASDADQVEGDATLAAPASPLIVGDDIVKTGRRASLSDVSGEDGIEELSVRQLKEILTHNFVDYRGCCEKWELTERALRLYRDRKGIKEEHDGGSDNRCCICMDAPIECVLLECGHMITCTQCGNRMRECPICRQHVSRAVRVFRP